MEVFKNIIEYVAIIMSAIILVTRTNFVLNFFQQSHYSLGSFKKIIKYYYLGRYQYLVFGLLLFILYLDKWYVQLIFIFYLATMLIIFLRKKDIIKLKQTARIYRNYIVILLLGTLISSTILLIFDLSELVASLSIIILILPLLIFLSSVIILPIEKLIGLYYVRIAKKKLKKVNPTIIGITGSFGKTSTKNILNEFLKEKYITLSTHKSYNTVNGICITINDYLAKEHEVLILEMGASYVGDIVKLIKLAKPKYAVVTGVTEQHLETFRSINNILNEKMQIIECLDDDGIGFINGDDNLIKSYPLKTKAKIVRFGLNPDNDFYASDIMMNLDKMEFKINFDNTFIKVQTKLMGRGSIYNILAAFSVARCMNVKSADIKQQISMLEATKHRLSVEKIGSNIIIDDSFNSNRIGFLNALDVLNFYPNPKILITPGIVEGGKLEKEINSSLALKIKDIASEVVLIKTKASEYIKEGLDKLNFDRVVVFDSFFDAKNYVLNKYQKASILIENDVSDIYKI